MNRKKFINLLSEEINNRLSSDSIITVVDFQNFFVIKGDWARMRSFIVSPDQLMV
jgi:hypothetical protein